MSTAYDTTYQLGSSAINLIFSGLSNNQCKFNLTLFEKIGGTLKAIDPALFTYTPPVIAYDTTKIDPYWYKVN